MKIGKEYIISGDSLSTRTLLSEHPFLGSRATYSAKVLRRYFGHFFYVDSCTARAMKKIQNYLYTFGNNELKEVEDA